MSENKNVEILIKTKKLKLENIKILREKYV
jgi:hypothetical protein